MADTEKDRNTGPPKRRAFAIITPFTGPPRITPSENAPVIRLPGSMKKGRKGKGFGKLSRLRSFLGLG